MIRTNNLLQLPKYPTNSSRIYSAQDDDTSHPDSASSMRNADLSIHPPLQDSVSDISISTMSHTSNETLTDQSFVSADQPMSSSPKPGTRPRPKKKSLRILIVNFQSLRKKGKLLEAIIIDSDPDIIIGFETWLDKSLASSEVLPNDLGFDIQQRDRLQDPHGGVLIAARRDLQLRNIHCSETI